jgi:hypothetical protein
LIILQNAFAITENYLDELSSFPSRVLGAANPVDARLVSHPDRDGK